MLLAFFESIKYVGYLLPLAFVRVYLGYYFLDRGWQNVQGDFLLQPRLAAMITDWLPQSTASLWYQDLLEQVVIPNWKLFAYLVTYMELVIGASMLLGFLVRPVSLIGMFLCLNFIYALGVPTVELHQLHLVLFVTLFWAGAGRCLGLDYFFFKRQRGLWW